MSLIIEPKTQFVGFDGRNRACSSFNNMPSKCKIYLKRNAVQPKYGNFCHTHCFSSVIFFTLKLTTYLTL